MINRGSRWPGLVVAVIGCLMLLGGCGGGASDEELEKARAEGAEQAREQDKIDRLERQVEELQRQNRQKQRRSGGGTAGNDNGSARGNGGGSSAGGPTTICQDNVSVGPNTSCAFAMNVTGEYGSNPGASSIRVYSPVTDRFYVMNCSAWSGGGTVCTGGNGATVYIR